MGLLANMATRCTKGTLARRPRHKVLQGIGNSCRGSRRRNPVELEVPAICPIGKGWTESAGPVTTAAAPYGQRPARRTVARKCLAATLGMGLMVCRGAGFHRLR